MKIEAFDGEARLLAQAKHLTDAERIRAMPNPYLTAVARCVYRELLDSDDHLNDKKVFHFDDGSSLTFKVAYTAE